MCVLHRTQNLHIPPPKLTFEWHHFTGLEVHLGAAGGADLVDVVTKLVAAILPAVEAQSLVEGLFGAAAVCHALLLGVQQRVDKQVDGALVGAFHQLVHVCNTQQSKENCETSSPHSDDVM